MEGHEEWQRGRKCTNNEWMVGDRGKDGGGRNGFKNGLIEKKLAVLDSWLSTRGKR